MTDTAPHADTFAATTPSDTEIQLTRLFSAPRDLVFAAMSTPEHIKRWWGNLGEGYSVPVCEVDLRVGGKWRFVNTHPKGEAEFYGQYREIDAPSRMVFTEIYAPFPMAASVVTATLTEEDGKTRLTATSKYPSKFVRDMVLQTGMEKGAAASYNHLEAVSAGLATSSK